MSKGINSRHKQIIASLLWREKKNDWNYNYRNDSQALAVLLSVSLLTALTMVFSDICYILLVECAPE